VVSKVQEKTTKQMSPDTEIQWKCDCSKRPRFTSSSSSIFCPCRFVECSRNHSHEGHTELLSW